MARGATEFLNVGGGVTTFWGSQEIGLRVETRTYLAKYERVLDFRIGVSFGRSQQTGSPP